MTSTAPAPNSQRRDYRAAFQAVRKLLSDPNDTAQVFVIMRALSGPVVSQRLARLLESPEGQRQAWLHVELTQRLCDPEFIAHFAPGTVGAAYRAFLAETGYSADGLAEVSNMAPVAQDLSAWLARRTRDVHDIWHVLTGYKADESLGEASLVAFSYAQAGGLGWAFIAAAAALKSLRVSRSTLFARAVWEGFQRGRRASWLLAQDYEALLDEPLASARARLNIVESKAYRLAQERLGNSVQTTPTANA